MAERLIEGVDHVQVPVKDIGIGCEWYSEVLGLEIITKLDHAAWLKFNEGPLLKFVDPFGNELGAYEPK
jgi:methylmalonyl-CoA/ethylmalonyl-CoA epimerase